MGSTRRPVNPDFEWSNTVPSTGGSRIVRTPIPERVTPLSLVFDHSLPLPVVVELDPNEGWTAFQAAVRQRDKQR